MQAQTNLVQHNGPCTLYLRGDLGVTAIRCRSVAVDVGEYAQYRAALFICYVDKGRRREVECVQAYQPSVLVVAGHDAPEPDDDLGRRLHPSPL